MENQWYPANKKELSSLVDMLLKPKTSIKPKTIHGLIVPHAGYIYSGEIAGKAYSLLEAKKALILAPNHYFYFDGVLTHDKNYWETPLGNIKIIGNDFKKRNLKVEHSIGNQIPFLQKIGAEEILPLSVGKISMKEAEDIAGKIRNFNGKFVVSTDLSHFHDEKTANILDKKTIKIIEDLDIDKIDKIDACGIYPLMVLIKLCKIKNWKPKLLEYETSGRITGDFSSVVGYASFVF